MSDNRKSMFVPFHKTFQYGLKIPFRSNLPKLFFSWHENINFRLSEFAMQPPHKYPPKNRKFSPLIFFSLVLIHHSSQFMHVMRKKLAIEGAQQHSNVIKNNNNLWLSFLSPTVFLLWILGLYNIKHENHPLSIMGCCCSFSYGEFIWEMSVLWMDEANFFLFFWMQKNECFWRVFWKLKSWMWWKFKKKIFVFESEVNDRAV